MPSTPSPTYQRLRHYIAKRMRMSHVDQPLMLMELLGHRLLHGKRQADGGQGSPSTASPATTRVPTDWWAP
jgi:hypothetical protein